MSKHFRATHNETKEVIEFDLLNIASCAGGIVTAKEPTFYHDLCVAGKPLLNQRVPLNHQTINHLSLALDDYNVEYHHKGKWFKYHVWGVDEPDQEVAS